MESRYCGQKMCVAGVYLSSNFAMKPLAAVLPSPWTNAPPWVCRMTFVLPLSLPAVNGAGYQVAPISTGTTSSLLLSGPL